MGRKIKEMSVQGDVAVPSPDRDAINWDVMNLPVDYRRILIMETYGTSYIAIDHVLADLLMDQDRIEHFFYNNGTFSTILYDAQLKIGLCTKYVFHDGKFFYPILTFLYQHFSFLV